MKKKRILGINIAAMVMDIIMTFYTITALFQAIVGEPMYMVFGIATLVVHIVSAIQCKKAALSNTGNVLGFVADGILLLSCGFLWLPAFIIYIIAACKALNPPTVEFE